MWKYLLAWIPMVFIAIANGVLRQAGYGHYMSELHAHQLSSLIAALLFGVYIRVLLRRWPAASARQALAIGLAWLVLTVAFEFLFGHYVAGHSWSRLFHDYNLLAGRVWLLVLAWISLAPYLYHRLTTRTDR